MSFLNGSGNQFAGTIGGFTVGDTIALYGDTVTSAAFSGHSIVATLISGATIELQTASALSGSCPSLVALKSYMKVNKHRHARVWRTCAPRYRFVVDSGRFFGTSIGVLGRRRVRLPEPYDTFPRIVGRSSRPNLTGRKQSGPPSPLDFVEGASAYPGATWHPPKPPSRSARAARWARTTSPIPAAESTKSSRGRLRAAPLVSPRPSSATRCVSRR